MFELYERMGFKCTSFDLSYDTKTNKKVGIRQTSIKNSKKSGHLIYCEDKFTAIDFDDMENENAKEIYELSNEHCNMIQKTKKGFHHIYKAVPELKMNTYKHLGVDIRSGSGSVLICEPSYYFIGSEKVEYKWIETPEDELNEMPKKLIDLLLSKFEKKEKNIIEHVKAIGGCGVYEDVESFGHIEEIDSLSSCLTSEWLNDYSNWVKYMLAVKATSNTKEAKELFLKHSARATEYNTSDIIENNSKLWDSAKPTKISIGSLKYYAKKCNPELYFSIAKDQYQTLIEKSDPSSLCEIFYNEMAGNILYSNAYKCYYLYDGCLWSKCDDKSDINVKFVNVMQFILNKLFADIPMDCSKDERKRKEELISKLKTYCNNKSVWLVEHFLPAFCKPSQDPANIFNQNPDLLPLENGVYQFSEKKLIDYEREHYFTFKIPIKYNPSADISLMQKAMVDWFKDSELVEFIQKYIGYCLTGYTTRQDFVCVWGSSAGNGKSLLWGKIMQILLGEYYHVITSDALSSERTGNNDQLYNLNGKRFAFLSEPSKGKKKKIDDEVVKNLTGDESFTVEAKHKNAITFKLQSKFVLACNAIPSFNFEDRGMNRRINILEQNVGFVDPETYAEASADKKTDGSIKLKDDEFTDKLTENTEGLLLWALIGANGFMDNKRFALPQKMKISKEKAVGEADTLGQWLKSNVRNLKNETKDDKKKITLRELKDIWKREECDINFKAFGFNKLFCEKAKSLGYEVSEGRVGKSEEKMIYVELIE
jgi:P4 family phage/plasmid primase-like protien